MANRLELQMNLEELSNSNKGRIAVVGKSEEGDWRLFVGMGGRSAGSRNRYYQVVEDINGYGDYIRTAVQEMSLQTGDPTTTLYIAHRQRCGWHVASNGEQTEGISVALALGLDFEQGQGLYITEGPKADYTARISTAVHENKDFALMGKIVRGLEDHSESLYQTYPLYDIQPGEAYWISTYKGDGTTEPCYQPPKKILLPGSLEESMDLLWQAYSPDIKAGLVGKEIEKESKSFVYSFRSIHPGR